MAYRVSGDRTAFDPMRLAYSLLTYVTSSRSLSGTAGREAIPGESGIPKEGTVIPPINQKLVDSALNAFFEEQNPNGMWDKGKFKFDKIELCSI